VKSFYEKELTEYVNETASFVVNREFAERLYFQSKSLEFRCTIEEFHEELQKDLDTLEM
jgi:hypothetical protein